MPPVGDIIDLGKLGLTPGGGIRFDFVVPVGEFVFGGQRYELDADPAAVQVDISRTSSGYVIRLQGEHALGGPCMRCCGDYVLPLTIDHLEVHEPYLGPELASEYVHGSDLDLAALLRDAIALALPTSIASPVDERGVCTECTETSEQLMNPSGEQEGLSEAAEPDPRWAKLRELEL